MRVYLSVAMGDELLKKTGSGNLFMVFDEPDIEVKPAGEGRLTVEVRGLDVYDRPRANCAGAPWTTSSPPWFLDTDYDGQQFLVRHAYFLGADEPFDKLKRALRADIDEGPPGRH